MNQFLMQGWLDSQKESRHYSEPLQRWVYNTRRACEVFSQKFPDEEFALIFRQNERVKTGWNHWMVPAFVADKEMDERNFGEVIWCKVGKYRTMLREQNNFMRKAGCGGHD